MAKRDGGWWVLHESTILSMLERVASGEEPAVVMAEVYANSEIEDHGRPDDD